MSTTSVKHIEDEPVETRHGDITVTFCGISPTPPPPLPDAAICPKCVVALAQDVRALRKKVAK